MAHFRLIGLRRVFALEWPLLRIRGDSSHDLRGHMILTRRATRETHSTESGETAGVPEAYRQRKRRLRCRKSIGTAG